jgi:transposase
MIAVIGTGYWRKNLVRNFHSLGVLHSICDVNSETVEALFARVAKKASSAIHILDRFHIMAHTIKAIDEVFAQKVKKLKAQGYEPLLKHSRWLLLKRPEHLTETEEIKLADLLRYNLKSVRSYLSIAITSWALEQP